MRVMPYTTSRGAMLLGDAPAGAFGLPAPVEAPSGDVTDAEALTFRLTSGDSGDAEPSKLRLGAERGWISAQRLKVR